ncbi:hypothetical protein ABW20_dc0107346 [Dactylellina cionopaga]|nr:hypothetical protein ABW20_dc0107346 [Dactylellina cionopaga]
MSSSLRHRKSSSEPSGPSGLPNTTPISPPLSVPSLMEHSTSRQVQVTALSLTSLLTTLTTTEGITTTARKLYTYPTKRLSSSELWRRYKNEEDNIVLSSSSSGSTTPPPDYEEEALALTARPSPSVVPISSIHQDEDPSLVSAKFAMQGHNLLSLSLAEPANSSFRRHLYLDSLTYLLRALPSDLSPSETTQLVSSLPPSLVSYLQPPTSSSSSGNEGAGITIDHPTIHYLLLVLTATTVSSVRNMTPHLKSLAQSTWEYNLKYKVAERGYERVRRTVDSGFSFWKAVAEWVMFEDCDRAVAVQGQEGVVVAGKRLRYGGGIVRDMGRYAGGVIRSGIGGVVDGFVRGMKA